MRKLGMIPYFVAAVVIILGAAALTNWGFPQLGIGMVASDEPTASTVGETPDDNGFGSKTGTIEPLIDPDQFMLDPEDFIFDSFEEDEGLSYTGVGGSS